MVHELGESEVSWKRVLPAMDSYAKAETVLPYEVATELIRTQAKRIAVGICACREMEKKCDAPLETCLAFDEAAGFLIEYGMGREITVEEAAEILKKSEEAGLVHMSSNNKSNLLFMCNCCPDCCNIFRTYTEFNYPDGIAKASVYSSVDKERCVGCGTCQDKRCPVKGAIMVKDGKADVDQSLCIGCGLCVSTCPSKAISLVQREEIPDYPETLGELSKIIWKTKQTHRNDPEYIR
jgi:ferredoxin